MTAFSWAKPDYVEVMRARVERLKRIRANPAQLPALKLHYANHPGAFIRDWGMTSDPRARARGLPVEMPLVLFPRQEEMLEFITERMAHGEPGIIEKSRDCGASWLSMSLAATLCLFGRGVVVGVGSRKESMVDAGPDPASLMWKARFFLKNLPAEFRGGFDETRHAAHMRILVPETGSSINGEAGDGIGRGGRSTVYFVDEAAFVERPQLIEASLASNTDCRIDVSTPNGRANAFATKRHSGRIKVFTFSWRDDPRKDDAWYRRQCDLLDPVTRAQEIDLNYDASVEGILLPAEWVHAAVGAHEKLGIVPSGERHAALDVADEGADRNALAGRHGVLLEHLSHWSGKNSDVYRTTVRAFAECDGRGYPALTYDADGIGAGVRGDAVAINEKRREAGKREIAAEPFRGSAAVSDPDGSMVEGRTNRDYFANLKAQAWWALRLRLQQTYRAVVDGMPCDPDSILSIDAKLPELQGLLRELVQPTYSVNAAGKILVEKTPDGAASPNMADAVCYLYSPFRSGSYFAGVRSVATAGPSAQPAPLMPARLDKVFASLVIAEDVAAIVYCAALNPDDGSRGVGLWILDYDLTVLAEGADEWLVSLDERLEEARASTPAAAGFARLLGTYLDDFEQGWANALDQLGLRTNVVGEELPPLAERYNKCRPYIARGLVALGPVAARKEVAFKGGRRNFLREVLGAAVPPESSALALAFATAVLLTYHGRAQVPTPALAPEQFAPPQPPPTAPSGPMWQTATGCWIDSSPPPEGYAGPLKSRIALGF